MKKALFPLVGLIVIALRAGSVEAQLPWDAPLLVSPQTPPGWGVYLVDPEYDNGIGFLTTWRGGGPLGFRVGLAEDAGENLSVYGGVDYSRGLVEAGNTFPLYVSWVTGAGFGVGDDAVLSFPLGISFGRAFQAETTIFNPSVTPRLVLDAWLGGQNPERGRGHDDLDLGLAVDFDLDISFDPGWAVRFGVTGGDRDAVAIGISFQVM
jgi:hypothetical protein